MPSAIRLGICAMPKKANCKQMQETLGHLDDKEFQIVIFSQETLFDEPIEKWPIVDALICFFSSGFPQSRAEEYVKLRNPFLVNDLESQRWLRDRRIVYKVCLENNIPTPKHIFVNRDDHPDFPQNGDRLIEGDGYVEIDGCRIEKPFVEKPIDADDHNIFIYYPRSVGGGRKELFRKIGDRSSEFYPDRDRVRKEGSFVYEEFLTTEGTDVKVYAVTGVYAYAEGRKSPAIDGRVLRDENQLEVRYPVTLNSREKELAIQICACFKQRVCGFDMLRSGGKTYVCDVNGWSFVKRSPRHLKDTAMILSTVIKTNLNRHDLLMNEEEEAIAMEEILEDEPRAVTREKRHEELRAVQVVVRHSDRTPKQKLKMKTTSQQFISLVPSGKTEVKLKTAAELGNILSIVNQLLEEYPVRTATPVYASDSEKQSEAEFEAQLLQARAVLEIGGKFQGINRKVQIKVTKMEQDIPVEVIVVIKWGGTLTNSGRQLAEEFGRSFRERLYPGDGLLRLHSTYRHDLKIYASDEGRVQVSAAAFAKGLLDLEGHLTPLLASLVKKGPEINGYLDDSSAAAADIEAAKVSLRTLMCNQSANSEPNAASVEKAIQDLNGNIPEAMERLYLEIKSLTSQLKQLVQAVRKNAPKPPRGSAIAALSKAAFTKSLSEKSLTSEVDLNKSESDLQSLDGGSAAASLGFLQNGQTGFIDRGDGAVTLSDMLQLSYGRWDKLFRDFYKPKTKQYDVSKIPDIYDSAKYDVIHNRELLALVPKHLHLVYYFAKHLADIVVPLEYGATPRDKFILGSKIARKLVEKIKDDLLFAESAEHRLDVRFARELGIKSTDRHVITRVYFTSESHMHSLLNVLRYAHVFKEGDSKIAPIAQGAKLTEELDELDYLSHIVFRMFETTNEDGTKRSVVRVAFSSGVRVKTVIDEKTKTILSVNVGDEDDLLGKKNSGDLLNKKQFTVRQLPPAAPLIPLWQDLELDTFFQLLDTVQEV